MSATRGTRNAAAESAVEVMRLYLGSVDWAPLRAQQRLFQRAQRAVEKVAVQQGAPAAVVWPVIESEARRRGILRPVPGKDF